MFRSKKSATPAIVTSTPRRELTVRMGHSPARPVTAGERLRSAPQTSSGVDVRVVFDTTGSMFDKLDGLVACTRALAAHLERSGLDWRLTAIPFGDLTVPGDTIEVSLPWVANHAAADRMLRTMRRNRGGGNGGESSFEAVTAALAKKGRPEALSVVLLITDEPALTHAITPQSIVTALQQADVLCNVVSPDIAYFRHMADATGGSWLRIAAHVDMTKLTASWTELGTRIALRASKVAELGGSPQRALAVEAGDGR